MKERTGEKKEAYRGSFAIWHSKKARRYSKGRKVINKWGSQQSGLQYKKGTLESNFPSETFRAFAYPYCNSTQVQSLHPQSQMKSTRLNTPSSSSGGGINGGNRRSSSPPNPEDPKFSPSTIITPSLPSRFIGPLQYVEPAYIRRVDSILRSFPTDTDPAEVYTALKARLGIPRSKEPTPPPPTEGLPRPSDPPLRRKEAEFNLSSTIEEDSIPRRTRHQAMNQLFLEAEGSRQQMEEEGNQWTRAATEASKTVESRGQGQEEGGRKCPSSSQEGPPFQPRFGGYQRSQYASQREGEKE